MSESNRSASGALVAVPILLGIALWVELLLLVPARARVFRGLAQRQHPWTEFVLAVGQATWAYWWLAVPLGSLLLGGVIMVGWRWRRSGRRRRGGYLLLVVSALLTLAVVAVWAAVELPMIRLTIDANR